MCSNVPAKPTYGVYISQLVRICANFSGFVDRYRMLTERLIKQVWTAVHMMGECMQLHNCKYCPAAHDHTLTPNFMNSVMCLCANFLNVAHNFECQNRLCIKLWWTYICTCTAMWLVLTITSMELEFAIPRNQNFFQTCFFIQYEAFLYQNDIHANTFPYPNIVHIQTPKNCELTKGRRISEGLPYSIQ